MITIEEAVHTYVTAFNTNDPLERDRLIRHCFAVDGTITSNTEHLVGHAAILHMLSRFRDARPDDQAVLTSEIDWHHTWFRFWAAVIRPDGSRYSNAMDIGEVGADGRIHRIITFFEELSPSNPDWAT